MPNESSQVLFPLRPLKARRCRAHWAVCDECADGFALKGRHSDERRRFSEAVVRLFHLVRGSILSFTRLWRRDDRTGLAA